MMEKDKLLHSLYPPEKENDARYKIFNNNLYDIAKLRGENI
jgi:hypothetical protein